MTKQEKLRYEYFFETGIVWIDTNYNIEMDYLEWVENKALNIPVVSKRFFELTRDDLAKFKSDLRAEAKQLILSGVSNLVCDNCRTRPLEWVDQGKNYLKCKCGKVKQTCC